MRKLLPLAALAALAASPAQAGDTLTFEGIGNNAPVGNFYAGYSFSASLLGLVDSDAGGTGGFANEPSASTVLIFSDLGSTVFPTPMIDVNAGFSDGFTFYYSTFAPVSVSLYSGLGSTGVLLGTTLLQAQATDNNCGGDPGGIACNWTLASINFSGTAHSVVIQGSANQTAFDNITFGAASTGAVPEPGTWAMMLLGFGAIGFGLRRRRMSPTLRAA